MILKFSSLTIVASTTGVIYYDKGNEYMDVKALSCTELSTYGQKDTKY